MCENKQCILLTWRRFMAANGMPSLPSESDLSFICAQGRIPDNPPSAVASWGHAISFLLNQAKFGVTWEGIHLTGDLLRPLAATIGRGSATPLATSSPTTSPNAAAPVGTPALTGMAAATGAAPNLLDGLRAWRDRAVKDGALAAGAAPDHHLVMLIRPAMKRPADVGQRVAALAPFAQEVFDVVAAAETSAAPASSTTPATTFVATAEEEALPRTVPRSNLATAIRAVEAVQPSSLSGARPVTTVQPPADYTSPVYPSTAQYPGASVLPSGSHSSGATTSAYPGHVADTTAPRSTSSSVASNATESRPSAVTASTAHELPSLAAAAREDGEVQTEVSAEVSADKPGGAQTLPSDLRSIETHDDLERGFAEALSVVAEPASTVVDHISMDGRSIYRWPAQSEALTIYRVVVSDSQRPLVPEMGDLLAVTQGTEVEDGAPIGGLFRFVQVWANSGDSIGAAKAAQPRLVAECVRVAPVHEVSGSPDFGQVALVWTAPPGASRVRVFRLPPAMTGPSGFRAFEIATDRPNLGGVVDRGGEAGAAYVYRMIVEARDPSGGSHQSSPVDLRLEWPAVIREVTNLAIHTVKGPTRFESGMVDLTWTALPVGDVQIYRLKEPLGAGILGVEVDKGALPQMGLTDSELCKNPQDPMGDDQIRMAEVPWPPGWPRIHFVPVTILGQRALPGRPSVEEAPVAPGDPRLVDRVAQQVITFVWPEGATYVRAYIGPVGAEPHAVCSGNPHHQVTEEDYRRHGGLRMAYNPPSDAAVFLTGVRGDSVSAPVAVPLPKRWQIRYSVELHRRRLIGPVDYVRVAVWAPNEQAAGSPPFVVAYNQDRLPMHPRDGVILTCVPDATPDASPTQVMHPQTLIGGPQSPRFRMLLPSPVARGYVRLFVSPGVGAESLRRIVVLDPSVTELRWA